MNKFNGGDLLFSDNYIKLCAKKGKHVTTVAEEIGFSRSAGQKWANGSTPHRSTLIKIAAYFEISVEELLADNENARQRKADGLSDRISGLDADLQKQLIEFVELAQANPKTAKRFLSFALEELRSSAQVN